MRPPVTLHVSLSPGDLRHARLILPHQLRMAAPQVAEVVLTVDGGEHSAPDLSPFTELAAPFRDRCPHWQIRAANHALARRLEIGRNIFHRNRPVPHRTYRRGPCLAYYDGWAAATQRYLLHLDSDMLLGGDLGAWISSSLCLLESAPEVFVCNPLPGPPRIDRTLNQPDFGSFQRVPGSHTFRHFTSRIFLLRRNDLVSPMPPLPRAPAAPRPRLRAWLEGLPTLDLPENLLTRRMHALGQCRVDHPGSGQPAFSLHPPHRNDAFFSRLPELVRRAETDDFPDAQRGCYDINEALIDWSPQIAALARRRWWRVLLARFNSGGP
jgi:hypothetical protein